MNTNKETFDTYENSKIIRKGVSAMLRVKNEETKIILCLESIYSIFDEIIFVDNLSTDRTMLLVEKFKKENDTENKLQIFTYPFLISKCGTEHRNTHAKSKNSLVFYNNWAIDKSSFNFICKWDADMILKNEYKKNFHKFLKACQNQNNQVYTLRGQTIYKDEKEAFYTDTNEVNDEVRVFPNVREIKFKKAENWEALSIPKTFSIKIYEPIIFYELKYTGEDEFSHWTSHDELVTKRKRLEYKNFMAVKSKDFKNTNLKMIEINSMP